MTNVSSVSGKEAALKVFRSVSGLTGAWSTTGIRFLRPVQYKKLASTFFSFRPHKQIFLTFVHLSIYESL